MDVDHELPPNHHADHPGFSGISGLLGGLTMAVGRGSVARLVADLTGTGPGDHVVDVGCGPGTAVREAARRGATATGIDPAPVMRRLARVLTRPGRRIRWQPGVAENLPLADGSLTVLWSIATVHHWPDLDRGLAEAHRVLASDGQFLAAERRTFPGAEGLAGHGWTDGQATAFARLVQAAGFTDVAVATHPSSRGPLLVVTGIR
jgi:ubiquinone/menaquinone biosynthesis C-methylase UbiE